MIRLIILGVFANFLGCSNAFHHTVIFEPVPIRNTTDRKWMEGWIKVSENRMEASTNMIELPFVLAFVDSTSRQESAPVLIMSGGPGNSSLHMPNGVVNTAWGKDKDILVLEQRGTTHAKPYLKCPEIDSMRIWGMMNKLTGDDLDSIKLLGIELCYNRLKSQNIDLDGYNTLESVEDIEALRRALNIERLVLYGMSYSCNLMATYAQKYPNHTKALILDSPLPHDANYEEEAFENIDRILAETLNHYTGSNDLYIDWVDYVITVEDSTFLLNIEEKEYHYTKNELIDVILNRMSGHNTLKEIPAAIHRLMDGDHQNVAEVIQDNLGQTRQAKGMRYSLWVAEELPEEDEENVADQAVNYPWLSGYPANDVSFETASMWKVNSIYNRMNWPENVYDGPVLILSGAFDPWTPPWYGKQMMNILPNAQHIIYPEHSHLPGFTNQGFKDIHNFLNNL